jgi:UDP-2-acetamido-2,6-beta-L-arabino-hexul-4-ose reductase
MPRAIAEAIRCARDARGLVFEPIGVDAIPSQRNVHVAVTEPGGIRGNHFHNRATETTVVLGPALVRLREDGEVRELNVPPGETWRFIIPPGVGHAFQNTGTQPLLLVAFSTSVFDPATPDVVRDGLI